MPPAAIAPPVQNAPPPSYARLSDDDRRHIAAMDAAVARMRRITPAEPYYITVPQDDAQKYRHQSRAGIHQWAREQPFDGANEREWQQYQTFKFREPGKDLLALHSHDSVLPKPPAVEKNRIATGTNTPNQAPKKVTSFGDYKKKRAGQPVGGDSEVEKRKESTTKQPALKGPAEKLVSKESAEMLAEIQAIEQEDEPSKATKKTEPQSVEKANSEKQDLKRKRGDSAKAQPRQSAVNGKNSPPPAKKARTTPPPVMAMKARGKEPTPPRSPRSRPVQKASPVPLTDVAEVNLPPKLSPLRENSTSRRERKSSKFPDRLTPTLPTNIVASLEQRRKDTPKQDHSLTPSAGQNDVTKHKSPVPRNGFRASSISPANGAAASKETRPVPRSTAEHEISKTTKPQENRETPDVVEVPESLVVKIKIKKALRDTVRRILAFPPKPSKAATLQNQQTTYETQKSNSKVDDQGDAARRTGKGVAQKVGPATKKNTDVQRRDFSDKRPRTETEHADVVSQQPPTKKIRASEPQQTVSKPAASAPEKKRSEESQQLASAEKKSIADKPKTAEQPSAGTSAKRKHQGEVEEQQPAIKKSRMEKTQSIEPKPAAAPAKDQATKVSDQQETAAKKKKPDQARYEPPSRKRSIDAGPSKAAPVKSKPESLELKKTPSTPTTRDLQSPTVSSANKSVNLTPGARRDLLSATRHRDASNDSQTSTPSGLGNTPLANGPSSTSQAPATKANGTAKAESVARTPRQRVWDAERTRLEVIGRKIKHDASDILVGKGLTTGGKTLAACYAVESLICYLMAYTCADRAALAATDPKQHSTLGAWRSMTGFFQWVQRTTQDTPLLSGLAAALGIVLHAHIMRLCGQQQPPVSGSALVHSSVNLMHVVDEAEAKLDPDLLIDSFPKTWKARAKGNLPSEDSLEPKDLLEGAFKLPIGVATAPTHGARAGLALLREFVENEKLVYEFTLPS